MKYSNCILTGSYSPIYVPIEDGETENEREKGQVGGSGGCSGGEWEGWVFWGRGAYSILEHHYKADVPKPIPAPKSGVAAI